MRQDAVRFSGHAIEARLCAEDPAAGFAPQTGRVLYWKPEGVAIDGVRIDHGLVEGGEVSSFYDPMVAKVIAHGETREAARAKLRRALAMTPLLGVGSNRAFLLDLLGGDAFRAGEMTTGLVDATPVAAHAPADADFACAAAVLADADGGDWFSSTGMARCPVTLRAGDVVRRCVVLFERARMSGVDVEGSFHAAGSIAAPAIHAREGRALWLERAGKTFRFEEPDPLARKRAEDDPGAVVSPVSGLLRVVAVGEGDKVRRGDVVALVEAMKMETPLVAARDGVVAMVRYREGAQVRAGDVVVGIE